MRRSFFITENDVMKDGRAVYPVERYVASGEEKRLFGDGSHILYVNGKYRGDDAVGKLMHDFSCENPDDMYYDILARTARFYKKDGKGVETMCRLLEEMCDEVAEWTAKETASSSALRMLKDGILSVEQIARYTDLPPETVEKLREADALLRVCPVAIYPRR